MDIDFDTLTRLIHLSESAKIHAIEIQDGNQKIKIIKYATNPHEQDERYYPKDEPSASISNYSTGFVAGQSKQINTNDMVLSPMLGTFYRKPSADALNFVEIGDAIKAGDTLCIVEAMKIMHEVKAEKDGIIMEILAHDGDMVQYDTPLFVIK